MERKEELPPKYKEGQRVYGKGGEEYEYVLLVPGTRGRPDKHLIRYRVEDGDGGWADVEETRPIVFAEEPEPTRHPSHVRFEERLRADRDEMLAELEELRTGNKAAKEERRVLTAQMERLRKLSPVMQRIEDCLDGNITHLVTWSPGSLKLESLADALETVSYDHHGGTRLLSLFGGTKGDLNWKLNTYSDGSGNWRTAVPCTSIGHAMDVALERVAEMLSDPTDSGYGLVSAMKCFDAEGHPFPAEARAAAVAYQRERLVFDLDRDKLNTSKRQQALDDFDASHKGGAQ